jgi:hypothetical protein
MDTIEETLLDDTPASNVCRVGYRGWRGLSVLLMLGCFARLCKDADSTRYPGHCFHAYYTNIYSGTGTAYLPAFTWTRMTCEETHSPTG